jgi:hypothetical protein
VIAVEMRFDSGRFATRRRSEEQPLQNLEIETIRT